MISDSKYNRKIKVCDKSSELSDCLDHSNCARIYPRKHPLIWLALTLLLGFALCMPYFSSVPSVLSSLVEQTVTVNGTVQESRNGEAYLWLQVETNVQSGKHSIFRRPEVLYVLLPSAWENSESLVWYPAGTKLQLTGELQFPQEQRNPGGFHEKQWMLSKQARMKLVAKEVTVLQTPKGIWKMSWKIQQSIKNILLQILPTEQASLAMALLLGEKQQLMPEFYRLTQRMGVAHIFAISGLHVGFVGSLVLLLFRLFRMERSWISILMLAIILSSYCFLIGFPASAVRATVMLLLANIAVRLLRTPTPIDFLALISIMLLLNNPFLLNTASFQLSFGVTLSLLLFVPLLQKKMRKITWAWLRNSLSVAIAAYVGSVPLSAWHFYTVSPLSVLYNLLLVPVVSVIVSGFLLSFLLYFFTGIKLLFIPVGWLLQLLLDKTVWTAEVTGRCQWNIGRPDWYAILLYGLFLYLFWSWLRHTTEKENYEGKTKRIECILTIAALLFSIISIIPRFPEKDTLLYLDAGQGSCALLRTCAGETVIFDGGTQQRELANCLAWYGINQVDAIVVSHGDADHITGILQVLEQMPVRYLLMESNQLKRSDCETLCKIALEQGTILQPVDDGATFFLKNGTIHLLVCSDEGDTSNSRELTALLEMYDNQVAFPGDLGINGVLDFVRSQSKITVWTVPHHGSRFSSSEELYSILQQKGIRVAVISNGKDNRYGHPHNEVLLQLEHLAIPIYRTDLQGAVSFYLNP